MYSIEIGSSREFGVDKEVIEKFLRSFGLNLDKDVEYTVLALAENEIVGTCSFAGKVLKCFAVKRELQGEGITARLITHLTNVLFDKGIYDTFIFTKGENAKIFEGLGYACVHSTKDVMLLEGGTANVMKYVRNMFSSSGLGDEEKAGLVMNCNPFTLGHRYLIEKASRENATVVIFIVQEDRSLFPYRVRLELVKRGTADLKNVRILPGGDYIISSNTFPSYFIKQEDERLLAYTRLDAGIFGKYIAPVFNIRKRYIGTEPFDRVTAIYNNALLEELPLAGIEVKLVERLKGSNNTISASEVRRCIRNERWDEVISMVPETTYEFLRSEDARPIIENIKGPSVNIINIYIKNPAHGVFLFKLSSHFLCICNIHIKHHGKRWAIEPNQDPGIF